MCGIVGLITKGGYGFNKGEQKMFYEMLHADMIRGQDATGVITCHNNGDFGIMKEAVESHYFLPQFIESSLDKDLFTNGTAVIGHNRYKTVGENKDEHSHPFVVDSTFAMVHNGTLHNHKSMHDTDVDSEALAIVFKQAMDAEDFLTAVSEAVWKVSGAFACVWYDQKRNQLGMIRNSQRPLGVVEIGGSILFSSEIGLAHWIAQRPGNNNTVTSYKSITEDTLYLYDLSKGGATVKEYPLIKKPIPVYSYPGNKKSTITEGGVTNPHTFSSTLTKLLETSAAGGKAACSKNAFKRFRKILPGKAIVFTLDDYVDVAINNPTNRYWILGSIDNHAYDISEVRHMVRGIIDLNEAGLSIKELDFQADWDAYIDDVDFDIQLHQLIIKVKLIKPHLQTETVH